MRILELNLCSKQINLSQFLDTAITPILIHIYNLFKFILFLWPRSYYSRIELKKLIKSIGEKCKVSIRNIRREANDNLKKLLKDKTIGEDEEKSFEKNVQTITDNHIKIVDDKVSSKEKEIMTI